MPPPRANRPRKPPKPAPLRTRSPPRSRPAVAIVGVGRLGGALAVGLRDAGWPVWVFPRSGESVRRAAALGLSIADEVALREVRLCLLAVPDAAVAEATATIVPSLAPTAALVHCAGALSLDAFGEGAGARARGSFHPLCAVSDPSDSLQGHSVALSATTAALGSELARMAEALGLSAIQVPEAHRAAYHAGAVLCAGGLVALASAGTAALAEAGIPEDQAVHALLPLMQSAIRGVEQRGLSAGLTGPLARGDVEVIRAHLAALPDALQPIYRELGRRGLALVRARLTPAQISAIEQVLGRN